MVYILLGEGFEEMEAIAPADLLRRAGMDTMLVGVGGKTIAGAHGISIEADCTIDEVDLEDLELLMLPGGGGGVASLRANSTAMALIRKVSAGGQYLAAICAAPVLLAELGVLEQRNVTCYPGMEGELGVSVTPVANKTVVDGRIITGEGPGAAIDFGLTLVRVLCGQEIAKVVQEEIHYDHF